MSSTTTSANRTARKRIGDGEFLELVFDAGTPAQAGRVEHFELALAPGEIDADRIARDAGLGASQQPVFAEDPIEQGRFAGIGPANNGDAQRLGDVEFGAILVIGKGLRLGRFRRFRLLGGQVRQRLANRRIKLGKAVAMLGRQWHRLAQSEFESFEGAGPTAAPLGLIGEKDQRLVGSAQEIGEETIVRHDAGASVDHEEDRVA